MASLSSWVATTANVLYPYGVILGFIGTAFTVVFAVVKFRGILWRIFAGQTAAARQSKAAADNSQATGDAIVLLTEALVLERQGREESDAARDREATRHDELLARTLKTLALYEQKDLLNRVERLEDPFRVPVSDDETDTETITGRHRLHTSLTSTVPQGDQTDP